jgi:hypothetical protein
MCPFSTITLPTLSELEAERLLCGPRTLPDNPTDDEAIESLREMQHITHLIDARRHLDNCAQLWPQLAHALANGRAEFLWSITLDKPLSSTMSRAVAEAWFALADLRRAEDAAPERMRQILQNELATTATPETTR